MNHLARALSLIQASESLVNKATEEDPGSTPESFVRVASIFAAQAQVHATLALVKVVRG